MIRAFPRHAESGASGGIGAMLVAARPLLIALDVAVIAGFYAWFDAVAPGFDRTLAMICTATFAAWFALLMLQPKSVMPGIPVALSVEFAFSAFYFLLFILPYVRDLAGLSHYWTSSAIAHTFSEGANQALILAVIGYVAFHLGTMLFRPHPPSGRIDPVEQGAAHRTLDWAVAPLLALIIAFFLGTGLRSADTSRYQSGSHMEAVLAASSTGNPLVNGLYLMALVLCIVAIARWVTMLALGQRLMAVHWLMLGLVGFWTLHMLVSGDRNNALVIALAAAGGIATFVRPIRWPAILAAFAGALILYQAVEVARQLRSPAPADIAAALSGTLASSDDSTSSFKNTSMTLRATFAITPDRVAYADGYYKLLGLSGVVPLIRGLVVDPAARFTTSAEALTYHTIGPYAGWSVGSNILSDIYMDFGLAGVPPLMALLGFAATRIRRSIAEHGLSSARVFVLIAMLALVAEAPRYAFDFPVRVLAWGWAIFALHRFAFAGRRPKFRLVAAPGGAALFHAMPPDPDYAVPELGWPGT